MNSFPEGSFAPDQISKALLSNALQVVFLVDTQFRIRAWNEMASANMKVLRGRAILEGESFLNFIQPDQQELVLRELGKALSGEVIVGTKKLNSSQGKIIYTRYNYTPVRDDDGSIFALSLCYSDLTAEVTARENAEKSAQLLDLIFQQNLDGLGVLHTGTGEWKANPEFYRILGLSAEEWLDWNQKTNQEEDNLGWSPSFLLRLPVNEETNLHGRRRNGSRFFARAIRSELAHPDGSLVVLVTLKDTTDVVETEKKRLENEIHFQTIARNFPNGNITVVDREMKVIFADGTDFESDLEKFTPSIGMNLLNQYGKDYAEFIHESVLQAFEGNGEQFELIFGEKTYSISINPIPDPDGSVSRVMKISQNVSEEKNARLDAHYRREYLRQIIDVDPNFIFVKNKEGDVTLANKAVAAFFGTSVPEFLENAQELFKTYKWRYEDIVEIDQQIFQTLKTVTIEEAIFHKETKKMHLFQVTRTPFVSKGNELSILCVGVDITDRVNAENELINQREYLRHILDTDPSLIFVKDTYGKYILVNRAFAEFYQMEVEDLIGKSDSDLPWPEPEKERFSDTDNEVLISNQPIHAQEYTINPISGEGSYFITTKKPLMDTEGNINILGVVTDITAQVKQEQSLRKSEFMLQQIFNKVADALFLLDAESLRIRDCNPMAVALLKAGSKEELLGQPIQVIRVQNDPQGRFWKKLFQHIKEDNPVEDSELYNLENEIFWGSLAATTFTQDEKEVILLRVSDISAQKKSEEQIMQALHEKEILIQEIHHRVKNNMAVISSLLQLQTGYIKDPGLIDVFRDSQSRIKSMALIHEKLYQSKTLAKVEMESYIKELTRTLYFTYNSRRIDLQIDTKVENVFLDINSAVPCGLIINEVISNAVKHAFVGREKGRIEIRFHRLEEQFELIIQDDGIGMPANTDFSSFKSLGMNLVQALSQQLGATVEFQTQNGVRIRLLFIEKHKPARDDVRR